MCALERARVCRGMAVRAGVAGLNILKDGCNPAPPWHLPRLCWGLRVTVERLSGGNHTWLMSSCGTSTK